MRVSIPIPISIPINDQCKNVKVRRIAVLAYYDYAGE